MTFYILSKNKELLVYVKKNFFIITISLIGNFFIFCYQIYSGKNLDPQDFGILNVFNNLLGILCLPAAVLQVSATKNFITILNQKKDGKEQFKFFFKRFFTYNFYFSFLYLFLIYLIFTNFLELYNTSTLFDKTIFFLHILIVYLSAPFLIFLQSNKYYIKYSFLGLLQSFLKFFFIVGFIYINKNYSSGLIANILSSFVIFIPLIFFYRKYIFNLIKFKNNFLFKDDLSIYLKNINVSTLVIIYSTIALGFDVIVFRELFPGDLAGYYSGISMIAKIPMFILSLTLIFFYAESLTFKNNKLKLVLFFLLFFSFLLIIFFILFFFFFGHKFLAIIFNDQFSTFTSELIILTLAFSFFGITKICSYILISLNLWKFFIFILSALFVTILFLFLFKTTVINFCLILLFSFFLQFFYIIIYSFRKLL